MTNLKAAELSSELFCIQFNHIKWNILFENLLQSIHLLALLNQLLSFSFVQISIQLRVLIRKLLHDFIDKAVLIQIQLSEFNRLVLNELFWS